MAEADPVAALRAEFRSELPSAVEDMAERDVRDLAAALRAARKRQGRHLTEATDASVAQIPALLRPLVRRAIGR
ncbi:hypothetical protein V5P93_004883 [Actinokineospora auranticolor]|uniref:hypothetical protein n=1 Tax=Actinokineospora auranticolor TaxID=155976 RepID=UPI0011B00106|nr:hypothetical protein [Actinokineospora auranticolor]